MSATAPVQQVNVRLDASLKRQAEEVLALMGSTATELIRSAYEKVARGAADYAEVMAVLRGPADQEAEALRGVELLEEGWAVADGYMRSVGAEGSGAISGGPLWDEGYEDAMVAHFEEKGLIR